VYALEDIWLHRNHNQRALFLPSNMTASVTGRSNPRAMAKLLASLKALARLVNAAFARSGLLPAPAQARALGLFPVQCA
jgi:hypothetical protein